MILIPVSIDKDLSLKKEAVLLGQWCKNKYTSEVPKENILSYHWEDRTKFNKDYTYIQALYETLLPEYVKALNIHHNSSFSEMFWRISFGNWLQSFITVAFDRWTMAHLASASFKIDEVAIINTENNSLIPKNMRDYSNFCSKSDEWNSYIFYKIFEGFTNIKIKNLQIKTSKKSKLEYSVIKKLALKAKRMMLYLMSKLLNYYSQKNKIVFVDSYLPLLEQWKIEIKLKQFPSYFKFDEYLPSNFSKEYRRSLSISYAPKNDFESFLISLIPEQVPISYLENFNKILSNFSKFPLSSSVKVIFTANAHLFNDQFNIWSAHAKENGAKLIIGQHGGGTRSLKVDQSLDHEYAICDYYVAWGKGGHVNKKNIILPVNKFSDNFTKIKIKKSGLLHVLDTNYRYIKNMYSNELTSSFIHYFNSQILFSSLIQNKSNKDYKLRPNKNSINAGWSKDFDFVARNETDNQKHFLKSIKKNRLILISVNQTTFLQSLAMNIPTVGFWDMKKVLLEENSFNDYKKLFEVGILFDSPQKAANHINDHWENIEKWWNSTELQKARIEFCDKYIYTSNNSERIKQWGSFFSKFL